MSKTLPIRTTPARSASMKRVRRQGTDIEIRVRKLLTGIGARYRLNVRDLTGSPDIANKRRKKAIFVHGCFWHFHSACPRGRVPTRNRDFWQEKLLANRTRDAEKIKSLRAITYDVMVIWECELVDEELIRKKIEMFWFGDCEPGV